MRAASRTRALLLCLGAVLAVSGAAWLWRSGPATQTRPDLRGANVLLVTIDTLRADRLGAYGGRAALTPALDALAARGVRFTHVRSHAPMTLPAHASILTGLLPPRHGVRNNGSFRLGPEPATLAERLRAAGYRTGAFVGAFVLDARFGLGRGFDVYDARYDTTTSATSFHFVERPADRVLGAATTWIGPPSAGDSRPWFAWVHLFDPHAPYHAPAAFAQGRAPYDAEVAWTDAALGAAFDTLARAGQLVRTLVLVTADHGESLGDHGETTHGLFAYDATLRVPLIVSTPALTPRVVSTPTAHVDIVPTVLDLLGVEVPAGIDGHSRSADVFGASTAATPLYFEALDANLTRGWAPLTGIVDSHWKYIDAPEPELYDLEADPGEQTNAAAREAARVQAMQARLRERAAPPASATAQTMDPSQAARLQSLGYVTGTSRPPRATFTLADDPKRLVALSERFNGALEDFNRGRTDAALAGFADVLAARPDFLAARLSAASVSIGTGRAAEAVRLLAAAPEDDKTQSAWLTRMGQALAADGKLRDARALLESAVTSTHGDPEPLNDLGLVLLRLGDRAGARGAFERLLAAAPAAAGTWFNLGLLEMDAKRPSAAAAAFRHVVALDAGHIDAWRGLGAALVADDTRGAADAWQRVLQLAPQDFDTLYNLGMLLHEDGRHSEARPYLQRFLAEAPRTRYAPDLPRVRAVLAQSGARP